ncbi:MBL fold metallo-hydrolase RNA specificity domain-containing protein [Flavobacterium soyae]|uniref:MBL fold metallo-hydrolase RNA specificity domain-containing protein n=1 Tax=Flavobacterium soyae TaxID=2903098 RepID=UPI001E52007A|nr:MBL fold metallo-hydrolase [Flavobacterium soyae]MCD9577324.1 MBL fold metallo-hydrolase [Flavobacterium soyae]
MKINFIGGAGTVTGSKTLIETKDSRILIDCGLFQGLKSLRELNWDPLPILPSTIDCVLLTHGHLDHCGWLPRLISQGFKGKIYCTAPTKSIAKLVLLDSAKIQEEEAYKANEEQYSKHTQAEPLYTIQQAQDVTSFLKVIQPNTPVVVADDITAVFESSGHIIGACSITLTLEGKTLVFSGDIGRDDDVLMFPPTKPTMADYLFLESTYGDRLHPDLDVKKELETLINTAIEQKGTVIIPGFAVERAQSIMFLLWQLKTEGRIPNIPYILDTPMGANALHVFLENLQWHKLSVNDCHEMYKMFTIVSEFEETIRIIADPQPKVVIAASGMVTGGRVLSYFEHYISIEKTTVIFVGYQAEGTRGRRLLEGADEIKIYGNYYNVRAKIFQIEGLSAHGDQEDLLNWLSALKNIPKCIYLVHGENLPADALRIKIQDRYHFKCKVPLMGNEIEI